MDLATLLKDPTKKPPLIPIMSAICGVNSEIMYSEQSEKLVIMMGFNRIAIIPLLHRNLLPFEGMSHKRDYLFAQQYHDKFVALDGTKNKVWSWCMQTGKLSEENAVDQFRISHYVETASGPNQEYEVFRSINETAENRRSIYD